MSNVTGVLTHIKWLWDASILVCGQRGLVVHCRRIRFLRSALWNYNSVKRLIDAPRQSPLGRLIQYRPQTVGVVIWPYQCSGWDARTRVERIYDHYAVIEELGGVIDFPPNKQQLLADLGHVRDGFRIIIDQPAWFLREGQLAINLFLGETRIYTLSFSLFHHENGFAAFIGAIQGRDIDGILEQYRELTKASHGMRPRDLLFEIFRIFCSELGVVDIFAVANEFRHHNDQRYFHKSFAEKSRSNYNEIWMDRGGARVDPMFFHFGVDKPERDLATVPTKKRAMYRRRAEMLRAGRLQIKEMLFGSKLMMDLTPATDTDFRHAREA